MKKTRAISLLLSLSLICAMLVPGAAAFAENEGGSYSGMVINKTATANTDGSYTITLEAYATGSKIISEVTEDVPTDIVLVLDQSGSMADCLVCGQKMNQGFLDSDKHNIYAEATSIDTGSSYYIKNGNTYTEVYYCGGYHGTIFSWECDGGAGWYTSYLSNDHTDANKITPKTDANPNGTQFYEYKSEACSSRLSALKTTLTNFADAVAEKAKGKDGQLGTADDVNHRIAVVGFASGLKYSGRDYNYGNTEVFIGSNQYTYNAGEANNASNANSAQSHYASAFQNMNTQAGYNNVIASKNALDANGGTLTNLGMEMANGIFGANPIAEGEKRNRVVIVFSDGVPGWNGYDSDVASSAITQASTAKSTYGATVYTIGIFSGADATSAGSTGDNSSDADKGNYFLQRVSSNTQYPQSPSYYLSAGDSASLNNIFQQISNQIETGGSSSTLTSEAVVKDIISPYFTLPAGTTASGIRIDTYACEGKDGENYTWSSTSGGNGGAYATVNGDQVSVTGFDFSENWCGTETDAQGNTNVRGKKLVISFKVQPKAGFLGGNDVITNTNAGIYENGSAQTPVMTFEQPKVDVTIGNISVSNVESNVYLGGYYSVSVPAEQIKTQMTATCGGVTLDLKQENFGLEEWQNEYVNIVVTVKDAGGNDLTGGIESLTEDVAYTVTITVTPKTETGSATEKTGSGTDTIHVFKPELTFKDGEVYYGDTVPTAFEGNLTNTRWVHYNANGAIDKVAGAEGVSMLNSQPTLTLTYTPDSTKIADGKINTKQDVPVAATVKIGTENVNEHTTFVHQDCTGKTCTLPAGAEFLLHVNTCQLTITKTGGNAKEPYVFTVKKDGAKYTEVTIVGNSSVTIYELPVGTYTIKEDTGWSWRFTADNGSDVTLSKDNVEDRITCTNTLNKPYWLNGFSQVVRNIFGISH